MSSLPTATASADVPWYAIYPAVKTTDLPSISCTELLGWYKEGKAPGSDFVLVDVRRNDHEGGTIKGSINLPAQSLHPSIPTLYALLAGAKVQTIIWYCGSSRGRGSRAAGWFADYLEEKAEDKMKSVVLVGGVKGWVAGGAEFTKLMTEYEAEAWAKSNEER